MGKGQVAEVVSATAVTVAFCSGGSSDAQVLNGGPHAVQGASVKKGQPIAYIEQLGTFMPVEVSLVSSNHKFLILNSAQIRTRFELLQSFESCKRILATASKGWLF